MALACPAPTISPVSISRLGTESARAPSVSTRLRLVSKVSVPVACGADQHVADPHGVRVGPARIRITLQRTLVRHVRAAVRLGVVDQQPRLEVLAVVGEVQAEQFGVAAGGVEPDPSP